MWLQKSFSKNLILFWNWKCSSFIDHIKGSDNYDKIVTDTRTKNLYHAVRKKIIKTKVQIQKFFLISFLACERWKLRGEPDIFFINRCLVLDCVFVHSPTQGKKTEIYIKNILKTYWNDRFF